MELIDFGVPLLAAIVLAIIVWIVTLRRGVTTRTHAVRESEERYALAMSATHDGIWERNFITGEVYRTPRICEILGYEPEELELDFSAFEQRIHPDDLDGFTSGMQSHIEDREPYNIEYRIRKKSGEYIWVHARGQAVWAEDGTPLRMAGSISDISDYKRADLERKESADRYRQVLENAPYAIIVTRRDGIMEFANRGAMELFRAETAEQFIGKDNLILLHADHHENAMSRRGAVLGGGTVSFVERKRIRFDNTEFMSESGATSCLWDGEPAVLIGIRDISDRIAAVEALRESEDRFRIAFENTGVGISVRNFETGERQFNQAFSQLFGYSAEEMETMRLREIVHPDDLETGPGITDRLVAGELDNVQKELRYIHKSGRVVWTVVNQGLIRDADHNAVALISAFQDISDLKRTEQDLQRGEERFRDFTDSLSDWYWEMGPDLRFTYMSEHGIKFTGYPAERYIGKSPEDNRPTIGDLQGWNRFVADLHAHRAFRDHTYERIGQDGQLTHISVSGKPLFGDDGAFLGFRGTSRDVTARVEAERQAVRSEERFQYAIENSGESFALYDADEKLVVCNSVFRNNSMLGTPFLSSGATFEDIVTSLAAQGYLAGVDETNREEWVADRLASFRRLESGAEYQLSNGRWRQARYDGLDDGSTVARYVDITEQRRQQDALRVSEQRYALAIAGTNDGIWERNFATGEVHRSARLYQIIGYEPGDLGPTTQDFLDLMPPEDAERCGDALQVHVETHAPFDDQGHYRVRRKSGELIWFSVNAQAEWDDDGTPIRMAGSISDISERKRAENNLIENEARFRSMADATSDWFWETDEDFCVSWISFDNHNVLSVTDSELIGYPMWTQRGIQLDDREAWDAQVKTFLKDRQPFRNVLVRVSLPEEAPRTISLSGFPLFHEDGTFQGYRGAATDVTRQISTEEQLRQAQKMEAVGLLTGGIAHEFNNLLMVVVGNIELLHERLPDEDRLNRFAETALKGAMRGAELTQSLLAFSRKQTLAVSAINPNDLVLELLQMLQRTLGETFILETELADDLPDMLADRGQTEGALLNLLINARDAMKTGGEIIVRTSLRTLEPGGAGQVGASPGEYVALEVVDVGHGMSAETIAQVFEPFFTTKDIGQGTGLGLSMVYGFAKQSNGYVEIESEVGRGTTVRFCLPRAGNGAHQDLSA